MTLKDLENTANPYYNIEERKVKKETLLEVKSNLIETCKRVKIKRHICFGYVGGRCGECRDKEAKKQALMEYGNLKEEDLK